MIHVVSRHCEFSEISKDKKRPSWFSKEKCFDNLLTTSDQQELDLSIVFDGNITTHFLADKLCNIKDLKLKLVNVRSGAKSYIEAIDHIVDSPWKDHEIVYLLEDDYLHKPNWMKILHEGMSVIGAGARDIFSYYVTLYDHKDKYTLPEYENLASIVKVSDSVHWRTTPSTTDTFITTVGAVRRHKNVHKAFSENTKISFDHERFKYLWANGIALFSCVPGYSTHVEEDLLSPITDWSLI